MINNIIIVEDEKLNADRLKRLIRGILPAVTVSAVLESVAESVTWFQDRPQPDLIFMDIRLSDGLSFDIFKQVIITCPVIFTTAYDEYAVQAFKHNGVDYLLKPVEPEELQAAMDRLNKVPSHQINRQAIDDLIALLRPKDYRKRFLLPYKDGFKSILADDISHIVVEHGITSAYMSDSTAVVLPLTMEELEQQLNPGQFFRANRQYIININSILHIHNYFHGKLKVVLKHSSDEIIISRNKSVALKEWMNS